MQVHHIQLTEKQLHEVRTLLAKFLPNTLVWAYGSRVTGKAKKYSDIDMVAFTTCEQRNAVYELNEAFIESDIPYIVDLFVWSETPETFQENIKAAYFVLQEQGEGAE